MRFRFGDFSLDEERRELRRAGETVHLSPKAFDLLRILVAERPRVVTQQALQDGLWPDTFVGRGSLHNLILQIRDALGDRKHELVCTAYGTGFSFAAPAVAEDESPATSYQVLIGQTEFDLRQGENVVGRDRNARVRIDSPSVSRRHACIVVSGNEVKIEDLGSKNGTAVNGRRARRPLTLANGDKLLFGRIAATFCVLAAPQSTETVAP